MKKFSELEYRRPRILRVMRGVNRCVKQLKKAADFASADGALHRWHALVMPAATQYQIAYIRNTMNMKDPFYEKEIKFYNVAIPLLSPVLKKSISALLGSRFRPQFEEKYGAHLLRTAETQMQLLQPQSAALCSTAGNTE